MTVYVTQELKGRDLSGALSFGELEVLVRAKVWVTGESVERVTQGMFESLQRFNANKDYLLLSGDPVVIGVAFMVLSYHVDEGDMFQVLRWDRIEEKYVPIRIVS